METNLHKTEASGRTTCSCVALNLVLESYVALRFRASGFLLLHLFFEFHRDIRIIPPPIFKDRCFHLVGSPIVSFSSFTSVLADFVST